MRILIFVAEDPLSLIRPWASSLSWADITISSELRKLEIVLKKPGPFFRQTTTHLVGTVIRPTPRVRYKETGPVSFPADQNHTSCEHFPQTHSPRPQQDITVFRLQAKKVGSTEISPAQPAVTINTTQNYQTKHQIDNPVSFDETMVVKQQKLEIISTLIGVQCHMVSTKNQIYEINDRWVQLVAIWLKTWSTIPIISATYVDTSTH